KQSRHWEGEVEFDAHHFSDQALVHELPRWRGAGFGSLKDTWADTTTPHGKLMLTVLGGLAEFERELIRARTGEGRKRVTGAGCELAPIGFGRRASWTDGADGVAPRATVAQRLARLFFS